MDANGDGLDDLGCWSQSGTAPLTYYLHNGITDLAASFTDGFGISVSATYTSIAQQVNYFPWNNLIFPYDNYLGSLYVVNGATFSDPSGAAGSSYFKNYFYAGASLNLQGRGFSGFGAMEQYDSRSGIWYTRNYGQTFPYVGLLVNELADAANLPSQS